MAQPEETYTTISKELTKPNPEVKNFSESTTNSAPSRDKLHLYPVPKNLPGFQEWTEFNPEELGKKYERIIHARLPASLWRKHQQPALTHWVSECQNEDMLEHNIIRQYIMLDVEVSMDAIWTVITDYLGKDYCIAALESKIGKIEAPPKETAPGRPVMEDTTSQDPTFRYQRHGFGKLGTGNLKPDWELSCSYNKLIPKVYGDTKQSIAFHSSRLDVLNFEAHMWYPVRQVLRYCQEAPKGPHEYGFIITDKELLVMQVTFDNPSPTIDTIQDPNPSQSDNETEEPDTDPGPNSIGESKTNRPQRTSNKKVTYAESAASEDNARPPRPSSSHGSVGNCTIKYRSIPWENHGDKVLTVRLGLFYLFLMSFFGSGPLTGPSGPGGPPASIANRGDGQPTSSSSNSQSSGSGTKTTLGRREGTDFRSSESTGSGGPSQNTRSKSRHQEGQEHQRIDLPVRSAAQ